MEAIAAAAPHGASHLLSTMLRLPSWRRFEIAQLNRAHKVASLVGLKSVAMKPVAEIAAGQQRLLDMARAVMMQPKVLLLDEPAAGLSDIEAEHLREVLQKLGEAGMTVILIDHNLPFIAATCARAVVLDAGALIYDGPANRAADDPKVRLAYVGPS